MFLFLLTSVEVGVSLNCSWLLLAVYLPIYKHYTVLCDLIKGVILGKWKQAPFTFNVTFSEDGDIAQR